jgi:DNA-directed RNA polymerase subunit RPC12/RpoP
LIAKESLVRISVTVRFRCPECEKAAQANLSAALRWQCRHCGFLLSLPQPGDQGWTNCVICGNQELYKKKNFPHWLGLTILSLACLAFLWAQWKYDPMTARAILIVSAAFDGLLYIWVGDAVVCYRCGADYRGFASSSSHLPFELTVAERYRQERLRRERLQSEMRSEG